MIAVLCFFLGVLTTLVGLAAGAVYLAMTAPPHAADPLTRLTQLQAEHRLQGLAQDALAQMMSIARNGR